MKFQPALHWRGRQSSTRQAVVNSAVAAGGLRCLQQAEKLRLRPRFLLCCEENTEGGVISPPNRNLRCFTRWAGPRGSRSSPPRLGAVTQRCKRELLLGPGTARTAAVKACVSAPWNKEQVCLIPEGSAFQKWSLACPRVSPRHCNWT